MEKEWNIKYVVKVLLVTMPVQKIHFTVRHPENALFLTGIKVNSSLLSGGKVREGGGALISAGVMSLAIPQEGDVFYNEVVFAEPSNYNAGVLVELRAGNMANPLQDLRSKNDYFDTCVPVCESMMEGFYEDVAYTRVIKGPSPYRPVEGRNLYKVTLYLRYELKSQVEKEGTQS